MNHQEAPFGFPSQPVPFPYHALAFFDPLEAPFRHSRTHNHPTIQKYLSEVDDLSVLLRDNSRTSRIMCLRQLLRSQFCEHAHGLDF